MLPTRFPSCVLVVIAAPTEVDAITRGLCGVRKAQECLSGAQMPLWTPIQVSSRFWVVRSGVSKANASGATAAALASRLGPWDAVLSMGIGGTLRSNISIGDVVVTPFDVFADEGVGASGSDKFLPLAKLGFGILQGSDAVPASPPVVAWLASVLDPQRNVTLPRWGFHTAGGATVSTCSGSDHLANVISSRSGAAVESMEGACVLLAAHHAGIAAGQVRVISNTTGDRESQRWDLRSALSTLESVASAIAADVNIDDELHQGR